MKGENAYGILEANGEPASSATRRLGTPPSHELRPVIVAPLLDDAAAIEIDDDDIRIDTYRSSGAGGQHVNKTDSACTSRTCRAASSSPSRTSGADRRRRSKKSPPLARLAEKAEEEREAELARERGGVNMGFGRQRNPQLRAPPVHAGKGRARRLRGRERTERPRRRSRRLHPRISPANGRVLAVSPRGRGTRRGGTRYRRMPRGEAFPRSVPPRPNKSCHPPEVPPTQNSSTPIDVIAPPQRRRVSVFCCSLMARTIHRCRMGTDYRPKTVARVEVLPLAFEPAVEPETRA